MLPIPELTAVDAAFCSNPPLPPMPKIPDEFQRMRNPWQEIAAEMFYGGGKLSDWGLTPKDGVDLTKAMRAIKACLGSFSPKHEHKMAGVAFMLSEWFDRDEKKAKSAA